jgi:hypothetical protein
VPSYPSIAVTGEGVFETFEKISDMLMERLESQLRGDTGRTGAKPSAPSAPAFSVDAHVPKPPAAPPRDEFIIDRGFDPVAPSAPLRSTPTPSLLRPAAPPLSVPRAPEILAPAASSAAVGTMSAREAAPLLIQRAIVLPVTAAELGSNRKIRLVLDITIDPGA